MVVRPSHPDSTPPCIQFIHGGPHGVTTTAFSPGTACLALEGCKPLNSPPIILKFMAADTVSQPNYSGSVGFGESSVRALLGNCGFLDVGDCIATVRHLVSLGISVEGKGKQFVMGGSHGGFLTSHRAFCFSDSSSPPTNNEKPPSHRPVPRYVQRRRYPQSRHLDRPHVVGYS